MGKNVVYRKKETKIYAAAGAFIVLSIAILTYVSFDMANGEEKMENSSSTEEKLQRYRAIERQSFANRDSAVFERFSEDMILVSNGVPTIEGRDNIRAHFEAIWKTHNTRFVNLVDETIVKSGDSLIVTGSFQLAVSEIGSSEEAMSSGRFLAIFKEDPTGEYVLWREAVVDEGQSY